MAAEEVFLARLNRVKELLKLEGDVALLLSSYPNVFYLSGLKASQAYLLLSSRGDFLLTDGRYFDKAKAILPSFFKARLLIKDPLRHLKSLFRELGLKKIYFEKDRVSCEFRERLKGRGYSLLGVSSPLKGLRMLKDPLEREKIREAVKITDKIYAELLQFLRPGLSELEVRGKVLELAFREGSEGEAFPSIVASTKNSAIPHWESSRNPIEKGPLLIDMGVYFQGYCSDFTRTLFLGRAETEFRRYYEMVKSAWYKAFEKVKVGLPIYEVDKAVRDYFQKKGVLSHFTHSTGHGIGIEIHEFPRVYYKKERRFLKNQPLIEEGMVFTIEPGLYFSERFGIRLENVVLVEGGEGKVYSEVSLELVEL